MAKDAAPAAPVMTPEEQQAEVEVQMREIGQRFGAIPEDKDELLGLLEEAAFCLTMVDQPLPESSMYNALRPTMSILVTNQLLEHPDPKVKVALASCLTEVTRITVREGAPYNDDVMKTVFKKIVETFGDLDDTNSPSFTRRVSILDTFSRVRCCILMLDLELDQMIVDMFRRFFKTASTRHSEHVTNCMENIMMFAIEESDDVCAELASCVLQNLTKKAQETLPASFGLAESVIDLCRDKLKPVLHELLKGTPLDEYSTLVTMFFQDAGENNVDALGKDMATEGKLYESVSDEAPQETSKVDPNVNCLGQEGTSPSNAPTTNISNSAAPVDNVKSPDGPDSLKQKQKLTSGNEQTPDSSKQKPELTSLDKQAKISEQLISCDKDVQEPVTVETEKLSDFNSKKDQELGSSIGSEMSEESKQLSKPTDTKPAVVKPKRGRPPAAKCQEKKPVGKKHKTSTKLQKEEAADEDISLKEMVSPTTIEESKGLQQDSGASLKRKLLQEAQETPLSKKNKMLDETLIGSRIKVWWPEDKMFYPGVIQSYEASSNKHKVSYDDGDVEILVLKKETWEFIAEEQVTNADVSSNMRRGRKTKGSSGQQMKEGKTGTPQSDVKNPPTKRGRPKGVRSSN